MVAYAQSSGEPSDTVTGPLQIRVSVEREFVAGLEPINFFNSAYATKCDRPAENTLDTSSVQLTLDRPFIFDGDTILAGTGIDGIFLRRAYAGKSEIDPAGCEYTFPSEQVNRAQFDSGQYTFTFRGRLSDGQVLRCSRTVFINF